MSLTRSTPATFLVGMHEQSFVRQARLIDSDVPGSMDKKEGFF